MATTQVSGNYIVEQIENAGTITYGKMFGEYARYILPRLFKEHFIQ